MSAISDGAFRINGFFRLLTNYDSYLAKDGPGKMIFEISKGCCVSISLVSL